ncbi:MAG: hypothetical protein ACRBBP_07375 [Bdellovibrionales bacterium]
MNRTEETLQTELQKIISDEKGPTNVSVPAVQDEINGVEKLSALQELSAKIELCLKKQQQVRFITKEIAEIVKKSS